MNKKPFIEDLVDVYVKMVYGNIEYTATIEYVDEDPAYTNITVRVTEPMPRIIKLLFIQKLGKNSMREVENNVITNLQKSITTHQELTKDIQSTVDNIANYKCPYNIWDVLTLETREGHSCQRTIEKVVGVLTNGGDVFKTKNISFDDISYHVHTYDPIERDKLKGSYCGYETHRIIFNSNGDDVTKQYIVHGCNMTSMPPNKYLITKL